jgi:hypothetical protein
MVRLLEPIGSTDVLFFVPETKGKTLEELNQVFGVRTRDHAAYGLKQLFYFFRRDIEPVRLYEKDSIDHNRSSFATEKERDATRRVRKGIAKSSKSCCACGSVC